MILVFGKPAFENVVVGDRWNLGEYFIQNADERLPHMTLIVMGWMVPRLRTNLLNCIVKMIARLLGIDKDPIPESEHDSYIKCKRTATRGSGAPAKKGDAVPDVLGNLVVLTSDVERYFEDRDDFQELCQWYKTAPSWMVSGSVRSLGVAERHGQTTYGMYYCSGCSQSLVGRYCARHDVCSVTGGRASYCMLKVIVNTLPPPPNPDAVSGSPVTPSVAVGLSGRPPADSSSAAHPHGAIPIQHSDDHITSGRSRAQIRLSVGAVGSDGDVGCGATLRCRMAKTDETEQWTRRARLGV